MKRCAEVPGARCAAVQTPSRLLATLTLAWGIVWVQRAALSPVGPLVQQELGASLAELGLLPALGVAGGGAGYLAAGCWARRSPRASLLAGAALLAVATLGAGLARSYAGLAATQALAGFAEGLFFVPALALVARAHQGPRAGRALGVLDTGISAGSFTVLLAAGAILPFAGWRGVFLAAGALGALLAALLAAGVGPSAPEPPAPMRGVLRRGAWPLYGAVSLLLVVYFSLLYLAPVFLVARGFGLADADLVAAAAVGLGIPWHVLGGALADRLGAARSAALFTALFALGLAALGWTQEPWATAALLVACYSLGIAGFVGLIAAVPRLLGAALAAPAFGVFWGLGYLGGAVGPFAVGAVADAWGLTGALLVQAGLAGAAVLLLAPAAAGTPPSARAA